MREFLQFITAMAIALSLGGILIFIGCWINEGQIPIFGEVGAAHRAYRRDFRTRKARYIRMGFDPYAAAAEASGDMDREAKATLDEIRKL